MADGGAPLVIYVPGLMPKPDPIVHRDALLRCLLAGVRRVDEAIADQIAGSDEHFEIVPWTFDFYGRYRNFDLDRSSIEKLLEQQRATEHDIVEAASWKRRFTAWLYRLGDLVPFLIPHIASERMEVHLRDLMKYTLNQHGIAERVRHKLKQPLRRANAAGRPVLLIGHSMGSVIAFDALWQLTHREQEQVSIDLLLTMGSPLGQTYIQRRLKGAAQSGARRYPGNDGHVAARDHPALAKPGRYRRPDGTRFEAAQRFWGHGGAGAARGVRGRRNVQLVPPGRGVERALRVRLPRARGNRPDRL